MIYRDSLGTPAPKAVIAGTDSVLDGGIKWSARGSHELYVTADCYEDLRDELRSLGWDCPDSAGTPGYVSVHLVVTHPATQAVLDAERAASAAKAEGATPCYLRYGDPPSGGRSRDQRDGSLEAGVSVYRGLLCRDGSVLLVAGRREHGAQSTMISDRPLYIVDGVEIGTGSDGEPLLRDARIVRRV
jgi:hypothetical protein